MIIEKSMMLITGQQAFQGSYYNTFKMIPVSINAPYTECVYDLSKNMLVVISQNKSENLHLVERLDENGYPSVIKAIRGEQPKYKQQRIQMNNNVEYYLFNKEEITNFINMFAVNADTYDFNKFFPVIKTQEEVAVKTEEPSEKIKKEIKKK